MRPTERRAIQAFLAEPVDLDDAVERTVRLLAQLTKQLAVVQYPSLGRSQLRHVELVGLSAHRLLVVVIADSGRVDQRIVDVAHDLDHEMLAELRDRINRIVAGAELGEVAELLADCADAYPEELRAVASRAAQAVIEVAASAGRTVSFTRARPTWPGSGTTSATRWTGCSRRWRSRWCCCGCSVR